MCISRAVRRLVLGCLLLITHTAAAFEVTTSSPSSAALTTSPLRPTPTASRTLGTALPPHTVPATGGHGDWVQAAVATDGCTGCSTTEANGDKRTWSSKVTAGYIEQVYLWTRSRPNGDNPEVLDPYDVVTVLNSTFRRAAPTYVLVHGFLSNGLIDWIVAAASGLLELQDCNVLSIQWYAGSTYANYYTVTAYVPYVGADVATLLRLLQLTKDLQPWQVHLVGHSLGAHVAGFVGKNYKVKLARITGLDPAGLTYRDTDASVRLDKSDAKFVDIIHTNACINGNKWFDCFGISNSIGHADFWPNGGLYQPGCASSRRARRRRRSLKYSCDHQMAHDYFVQSLRFPPNGTTFLARPAKSYPEYNSANVTCGLYPQYMGYYAMACGDSTYFLKTSSHIPFGLPDNECPSREPQPLSTASIVWVSVCSSIGVIGLLTALGVFVYLKYVRSVTLDEVDERQPIFAADETTGQQYPNAPVNL